MALKKLRTTGVQIVHFCCLFFKERVICFYHISLWENKSDFSETSSLLCVLSVCRIVQQSRFSWRSAYLLKRRRQRGSIQTACWRMFKVLLPPALQIREWRKEKTICSVTFEKFSALSVVCCTKCTSQIPTLLSLFTFRSGFKEWYLLVELSFGG